MVVLGSYSDIGNARRLPMSQASRYWRMCNRLRRRPSIEQVGALVSAQLMSSLERAVLSEERLLRRLQLERTHARAHVRRGSIGDGLSPSHAQAHAASALVAARRQGSTSALQGWVWLWGAWIQACMCMDGLCGGQGGSKVLARICSLIRGACCIQGCGNIFLAAKLSRYSSMYVLLQSPNATQHIKRT